MKKENKNKENKECEFEWYVFTSDNRETPVAGFNDGELALDLMHIIGDGAIRVNKIWF